jgi:hypothetical protein
VDTRPPRGHVHRPQRSPPRRDRPVGRATLIWQSGPATYRPEGQLTLDEVGDRPLDQLGQRRLRRNGRNDTPKGSTVGRILIDGRSSCG